MLIGARSSMMGATPEIVPVEYLESTGGQKWIDTGVVARRTVEMEMDLMVISGDSEAGALFGVYRRSPMYELASVSDSTGIHARLRYGKLPADKATVTSTQAIGDTRVKLKVSGSAFYVDGVKVADLPTEPEMLGSYNLLVFASRGTYSDVMNAGAHMRLYGLKIHDNGVLVRDFIPVRVGSGNKFEGAMYDCVGNLTYRNKGTGDFVVGSDKVLSSRDYVQDGLVAMWDGIENAGLGVHDANATTWSDLVGQNALSVVRGEIAFDDNACLFNGSTVLGNDILLSKNWTTYELVYSGPLADHSNVLAPRAQSNSDTARALFSYYYGRIYLGTHRAPISNEIMNVENQNSMKTGLHTISVGYDAADPGSVASAVFDGREMTVSRIQNAGVLASGPHLGGYIQKDKVISGMTGKLHSLRLYSRLLTAAEVLANGNRDILRFKHR